MERERERILDLERDMVNLRKCSEGTYREMYIYTARECIGVFFSSQKRGAR